MFISGVLRARRPSFSCSSRGRGNQEPRAAAASLHALGARKSWGRCFLSSDVLLTCKPSPRKPDEFLPPVRSVRWATGGVSSPGAGGQRGFAPCRRFAPWCWCLSEARGSGMGSRRPRQGCSSVRVGSSPCLCLGVPRGVDAPIRGAGAEGSPGSAAALVS